MGTFLSLGIKKGEIRSRPSPASGERLQTILLDARSCEFVAINATCVAINARGALACGALVLVFLAEILSFNIANVPKGSRLLPRQHVFK